MNVSRSSLLPYTADQMYTVIADIKAYPEFLNWCSATDIISESGDELVAKLSVMYGKLNLSFTTRNKMHFGERVTMTLVEGPFSKLNGRWVVQPLSDTACKVSLEMDFNFANMMTQKLFGKMFKSVIAAQLDAFQKRALTLYG